MLAILLIGTGRLTCSLSLLRACCVVADSPLDVVDYNVALLKLKLSPRSPFVSEEPLSHQQQYVNVNNNCTCVNKLHFLAMYIYYIYISIGCTLIRR